jgi:hypothetical protein
MPAYLRDQNHQAYRDAGFLVVTLSAFEHNGEDWRHLTLAETARLIRWQGQHMAVPLSQLLVIRGDEATNEVITDWHYWVAQSHCF